MDRGPIVGFSREVVDQSMKRDHVVLGEPVRRQFKKQDERPRFLIGGKHNQSLVYFSTVADLGVSEGDSTLEHRMIEHWRQRVDCYVLQQ